jgi:hypothetical protein
MKRRKKRKVTEKRASRPLTEEQRQIAAAKLGYLKDGPLPSASALLAARLAARLAVRRLSKTTCAQPDDDIYDTVRVECDGRAVPPPFLAQPMTQVQAFSEATRRWGSRAAVSSRVGRRGTVFRVGEGPDFPEDSIEPVFYVRGEGGSWEEAFSVAGAAPPPANPTPCTLEDALAAVRMTWGPRAFVRSEAADGGRPPLCVVGIMDAGGWELISQRAGDWTYAIRMLQEKIARLAPVLATGSLRGTIHKG